MPDLKWTRDPPTEAGWYLRQDEPGTEMWPDRCYKHKGRLYWEWNRCGVLSTAQRKKRGLYYGPIPEPREP